MRKIIFILFSIFCSFQVYSQLQNQLFGCVLGQTYDKFVCKKLKQNNYYPSYYGNVLFVNDVKYGGVNWPCVAFYFENNILSEVRFMQDNTTSTNRSISNTYVSLRSLLLEKYSDNLLNQNSHSVSFGDENVIIVLTKEDNDIPNVTLQYVYAPFIIQDRNKGRDEL